MRTIFVNRYFHPDQSATSRMVSALAAGLARQGNAIAVLASRAHHERGGKALAPSERWSGVDIIRLSVSRAGRDTLVGRAADYLAFHLAAMAWLARNARRGDVVVVCTDPPLISLSCALPVRLRGGAMVNWVMDLFPETAIELGLLNRMPLVGTALAFLRDRSVAGARLTICPTARMADFLLRRGLPAERIRALYHWSDSKEIFPVPKEENRLRTEWGLAGKFVVGYSGNLGRAHEFDTLIDAATLLRARQDIRFLVVGSGQKLPSVAAAVAERRLDNVVFKPLQPAERLAESLGVPDVHIVSLLPSLEHCIIPSKLYGIFAAGRPTLFIGDPRGEVAAALAAHRCGATVEIGKAEELALTIASLAAAPARLALMGAAARSALETDYAYDRALITWHALLGKLAAGEREAMDASILEERPS